MDISLFLAKVFGVYFIVTGVAVPLRRKELIPAIEQLFDDRPLVYIMSVFAFVVGLLAVVSHNVWVAGWPVVLTILAWLIFLEAIAYLLLPFEVLARWARWFNTPAWYVGGSAGSFALGVFLAGKGFQLL